jgi:hypothetical protein
VEAPEELEHRQQRKRLAVWNTVRLVDRQLSCPAAREELEAEPTLPHARLADDPDHLSVPGNCPAERCFQIRYLVQTSDES